MNAIFSSILCLFFGHILFSQPILQWSPNLCGEEKATIRFSFYGVSACDPNKYLLPAKLRNDFPVQISAIPAAYRQFEQPFFCKLETNMERKIKVPVKFRLGEVQYVDMLEGKSSYDNWMRTIGTAMNVIVDKKGWEHRPFWQQ